MTPINGRFLFASDFSHDVGDTGGEERHTLTISEIPSHSHTYEKFCYEHVCRPLDDAKSLSCYPARNKSDEKFLQSYSTQSTGEGNSHNNMPPYLTANCWKRTG